MRRLILLLMTGFTAIPLLAQLSGDGYYRIQNASSYERYLTISNDDKIDDTNKNAIMSGNEGNIYAYKTITDPVSDPSSIIYISKDNTSASNNAYNLHAQGIIPFGFLQGNGAELKIYPNGDSYFIYGSNGGISLFLVDNNGSDGYIKVARKGAYPEYQNWNIKPVDGTTEYLGIAPDPNIKVGDKYYTTIFADFPFELPEGMKAYYVRNYTVGTGEGIAELKEITGKVPANTPVILECSSLDPADNKLILLTSNDAPSAISGNKLAGVYFCYVKMKGDTGQENTNLQTIKNVINYDSKQMRVLGLVDGKLALVTASDDQLVVTDQGRYLPANKAYFQFTESAEGDFLLLDKESYEKAGGEIVIEKCATPTISVVNGKVHFDCETEDVEFHYGFTNPIFANSVGNDMEIPSNYNLTVYASRTGYENSELATMEFPVGSVSGNQGNNSILGDLNGDNKVNATDVVTLVNIITSAETKSAQETTVSDIQNSGCLARTRGDEAVQLPTIVLTKEGSILSVQLLNYESNCGTTDFNVTSNMNEGEDSEPFHVNVSVDPIIPQGQWCICPFNVSFTVHNLTPSNFYLDCWWYKGLVELTEGEPLVIEQK